VGKASAPKLDAGSFDDALVESQREALKPLLLYWQQAPISSLDRSFTMQNDGTTDVSNIAFTLALPDNMAGTLTETSLDLPDGLSLEDWLTVVTDLFKVHKSAQWAIGDALVYGERAFEQIDRDERAKASEDKDFVAQSVYSRVSEATGYDVPTLYDIASVSRSVPTSLRNETLSWSHYRAVRSLDHESQKYYLDLAAECRLSVARLRYEMQHDQGSRLLHVGPLTEGERLLLPPALQPPAGIEKPTAEDAKPEKPQVSPSEAKSFKRLELTTHMTRFEIVALEQFAKAKAIDTDIAIRALTTMALHASGDLQRVCEDAEWFTNVDAELEKSYLLYLGQTWFGDENKFPFDTENRPSSDGITNVSENVTKSKASPTKIDGYIRTTARLLGQFPDMTAADVQRNIRGISMERSHFILAQASVLHEAEKEEAKAREAERERLAKERAEAKERSAAEAKLLTVVNTITVTKSWDETSSASSDPILDPGEIG
jgi:hypothetical protein